MADEFEPLSREELFGIRPQAFEGTLSREELFGIQPQAPEAFSREELFGLAPRVERPRREPPRGERPTFFGNTLRAAGERGLSLISGLGQFAAATTKPLADYLEEQVPLGQVHIPDEVVDIGRWINQEGGQFGYVPRATWQNLKDTLSSGGLTIDDPLALGGFIVEQGIQSIPDMVAVMATLPAYVGARAGELGAERARHEGRTEVEQSDIAKALPGAVLSAAFERFGTERLVGAFTGRALEFLSRPQRIVALGAIEAGTEAAQESVEYWTARLGTPVEQSFAEMLDFAAAGAVAGAGLGGLVAGVAPVRQVLPSEPPREETIAAAAAPPPTAPPAPEFPGAILPPAVPEEAPLVLPPEREPELGVPEGPFIVPTVPQPRLPFETPAERPIDEITTETVIEPLDTSKPYLVSITGTEGQTFQTDTGNVRVQRFLPQAEAEIAIAEALPGGRIEPGMLAAVNVEALRAEGIEADVTADVLDLPQLAGDLAEHPRVILPGTMNVAERAAALTDLAQAHIMMQQAREQYVSGLTVDLENETARRAYELYTQALARGLRVTPREGDAVLVVEGRPDLATAIEEADLQGLPLETGVYAPQQLGVQQGPQGIQMGKFEAGRPIFAPKTRMVAQKYYVEDSAFFARRAIKASSMKTLFREYVNRAPKPSDSVRLDKFWTDLEAILYDPGTMSETELLAEIRARHEQLMAEGFRPTNLENTRMRYVGPEQIPLEDFRPIRALAWGQRRFDTATEPAHRLVGMGPKPRRGQVRSFVPKDARADPAFKLKEWQQTVKMLRALQKRYAPDVGITLVAANDTESVGGGKHRPTFDTQKQHRNGFFIGFDNGTAMIAISPYRLADRAELAQTLTHEFGHLLFWRYFREADPGTQERLYRAYERWLLATERQRGPGAFMSFTAGRLTDETFFRLTEGDLTMRELSGTGTRAIRRHVDYLLSFDEWAAENTSLWMLSNAEPLSIVQKFFHRIAQQLKRAYNQVRKELGLSKVVDFSADPMVAQFLEATVARRALELEPMSVSGARHSMLKSEIEFMRGQRDEFVSPKASMSMGDWPRKVLERAGAPIDNEARKADVTHWNWIVEKGWNVLQLAQRNPHIAGLVRYVELMQLWYNKKMQTIARAEHTLKMWRQLSREQRSRLGEFLFAMDRFGIEEGRWPVEEFAGLVAKHQLDERAVEVYKQIKEDFLEMLKKMETVQKREAMKIANEEDAGKRLREIKEEFDRIRSRPYFPHSRFGRYTLVVKRAGVVEYSEAFMTARARDAAFARVRERYPESKNFSIRRDIMPEEVQHLAMLPPTLLRSIRDNPNLQLSPEQMRYFDQIIFQLAPGQSMRRRFIERTDVPGFSLDAERAYAMYFVSAANHLARVEFANDLAQAVRDVDLEATEIGDRLGMRAGGSDITKRRGIAEQLRRHFDETMYPGKDWSFLRSLAFTWWLGFSPAAAMLNLTQVPLVTLPHLSARYQAVLGLGRSDAAALRALGNAYRYVRKMYTDPAKLEERLGPEFAAAFSRALNENIITESLAAELAAVAEGNLVERLIPGTPTQRAIKIGGYASSWMFQHAERTNRQVTFKAAWDLAMRHNDAAFISELVATRPLEFKALRDAGFSDVQARAYLAAKDAVQRTQFEYAQWARPAFMRGQIKSNIFIFYSFLQNTLWFARNSPGRGRWFLTMLAVGGLMGLPGAEDIDDILQAVARQLGIDFDPEREVRELIVELDLNPDLILHGISRFGFGLPQAMDAIGLPFPAVDMSRSIGVGRVIPGIEALNQPDLETAIARGTVDAGGAAVGIGYNLLQLMTDDNPDRWKRWEKAMPRALRGVSRGVRHAERGEEVTRRDARVVEFDMNDPQQQAEVIAEMLGFNPTRLAIEWDKRRMQQEAIRYWEVRKGRLLHQFDHAIETRDRVLRAEVRRAIRQYNREVPDATMRISRETLSRSRKSSERTRRRFEAGVPPTQFGTRLNREVDRLFTPPPEEDIIDVREVR